MFYEYKSLGYVLDIYDNKIILIDTYLKYIIMTC